MYFKEVLVKLAHLTPFSPTDFIALRQHIAAAKKTSTPEPSVKSSTTAKTIQRSSEKTQTTTSEALQTLTLRLNDTANTTEVLRRDVAALQLSNGEGNKLRQKLSELETKLQHEKSEREKLAKLIEKEKQERQKAGDALRASISEETAARREELRVVRSKLKALKQKSKVLQRGNVIHTGGQ